MKGDAFHLAWDILHTPWMVSDPEGMSAVARRFLDRAPVDMGGAPALPYMVEGGGGDDGQAEGEGGRIAIVPLHGAMTKYDYCGAKGTSFLADYIAALAEDSGCAGMVLDVDSGGGAVNAIPPMLDAVARMKAAGKPVYAHCDLCASAAYYVASCCDAVYLDNLLSSQVGSIGACYIFVDDTAQNPQTGERTLTIYPKESAEKNLAYRKALEGDFGPAEKELGEDVRMFQDSVRLHRPSLKADADGVMTGRMFRAADAVRLGLADAVRTLGGTVEAMSAVISIDR